MARLSGTPSTSSAAVGAVVVCLLILQASWRILRPAVEELMDRGAPAADRRLIEKLALSVSGVHSAHALRTRYSGSKLAVDLHVEVDGIAVIACRGIGLIGARHVACRLQRATLPVSGAAF